MGVIEILGIAGSVASIIGAVVSFVKAGQSKSFADKSEAIKDELVNFRKTSELAELKPVLIAARDAMDKYCTSSTDGLIGVNKEDDARLVQKAKNMFAEFSSHFETDTSESFNKAVDRELQKLVDAADPSSMKKSGRSLHREISTLYGVLTEKLREQQVRVFD